MAAYVAFWTKKVTTAAKMAMSIFETAQVRARRVDQARRAVIPMPQTKSKSDARRLSPLEPTIQPNMSFWTWAVAFMVGSFANAAIEFIKNGPMQAQAYVIMPRTPNTIEMMPTAVGHAAGGAKGVNSPCSVGGASDCGWGGSRFGGFMGGSFVVGSILLVGLI